MACLLKSPTGPLKGCVTFTTQERDNVIAISPDIRSQVEALKQRYVLGLHHNWHDYNFHYDPLFDFSMAGDGDLVEADGRDFARIPLDACNFSPPFYSAPRGAYHWDILYVARAVAFKGISEFFQTIRQLYDSGRAPRVLFICPLSNPVEIPGIPNLRAHFETLFTSDERTRITFLTLDWDYPFPFDAETLAFFYRSSRIFFHPAPEERRCRTAAYAWAGGMPVVCSGNVASILPKRHRRKPFVFTFDSPAGATDALIAGLGSPTRDSVWPAVIAEFSAEDSAGRFAEMLQTFAAPYGWGGVSLDPINSSRLDIRLGRHHGISVGANRVELSISEFCRALSHMTDEDIRNLCRMADPELAVREACLGIPNRQTVVDIPGSPETSTPTINRCRLSLFLKKLGLSRT